MLIRTLGPFFLTKKDMDSRKSIFHLRDVKILLKLGLVSNRVLHPKQAVNKRYPFFLHLPFSSLSLAPPNLTYFNLKPS